MATRARSARTGRTVAAAAFVILAAFTLTSAPAATAGTAGIDIAGPRYTYYYYAEPEHQNLVGMRVVTFCPDVPVEEWGERTAWYERFQDWVQCP
jgi:hypothetical protein